MRGLNVRASLSLKEAYATMMSLSPGMASRGAAPFSPTTPEPPRRLDDVSAEARAGLHVASRCCSNFHGLSSVPHRVVDIRR